MLQKIYFREKYPEDYTTPRIKRLDGFARHTETGIEYALFYSEERGREAILRSWFHRNYELAQKEAEWAETYNNRMYLHHKGAQYKLLDAAVVGYQQEIWCWYTSIAKGEFWLRPAADFFGEDPDKKVPRFTVVPDVL